MTSWWGEDLHQEVLTLVTITHGPPNAAGIPTTTRTEVTSEGWNVQPIGSSETRTAGEQVTSRWRASGPVTGTLTAGDEILWRGEKYRIDGRPQTFDSGSPLDHTEVHLIRWE